MISTEAYNTIYFGDWQQPWAVINNNVSQPYECYTERLSSHIIELRVFISDFDTFQPGNTTHIQIYRDSSLSVLIADINEYIYSTSFVARFVLA